MNRITSEESPVNERRDERAVLLDATAELRWVKQSPGRPWIRCSVDDLRPAHDWLSRTLCLAETRCRCAEWVGRQLGLDRRTTLGVSAALFPALAQRLLETTGTESVHTAHLCMEVLGWTRSSRDVSGRFDSWIAYAALSPRELPRWIMEATWGNLEATLHAGDGIANAGIPVGLSVSRETWLRFVSGDAWGRCATRWRLAPVLSNHERWEPVFAFDRTEGFIRSNVPDALPLLASVRASLCMGTETPGSETAARSAAEALLFAALEARPALKGRFQLNAPLDFTLGTNRAEGDLTAVDARLVVEIDGYHHFRKPEDYRRDRRKDVMLQEHGWFVVRFLAEDIVGNLEGVIESIEQNLARRDANRCSALII